MPWACPLGAPLILSQPSGLERSSVQRPRKKHHLSEVTQLAGTRQSETRVCKVQSIGPGVCQELEVKEWLLGGGGMRAEGMMHPHLRLSIPSVRWVGKQGCRSA